MVEAHKTERAVQVAERQEDEEAILEANIRTARLRCLALRREIDNDLKQQILELNLDAIFEQWSRERADLVEAAESAGDSLALEQNQSDALRASVRGLQAEYNGSGAFLG